MRLTRNLIAVITAVLFVSTGAGAQSTNPSSPTPLNGQYKGKGPSSETNYYFSFTGGPGDVGVRLDIKAKDYSTFARIEIGNNPSNLIAMHNMNASTTTGPASVTKEFKLAKQQTVRIKLTLDSNLADYTLSINGAGGSSASTEGVGNAGKVGKTGKLSAESGSKLGPLGSGAKPKLSAQGANGVPENKMSFTCPAELMYKIVPSSGWESGLDGQKRFLFNGASVVAKQLWCSYQSLRSSEESATIYQAVPAGYTCSVYNSGGKSRDFICAAGVTAIAPPPLPSGRHARQTVGFR